MNLRPFSYLFNFLKGVGTIKIKFRPNEILWYWENILLAYSYDVIQESLRRLDGKQYINRGRSCWVGRRAFRIMTSSDQVQNE